jgi:hypothetical protein
MQGICSYGFAERIHSYTPHVMQTIAQLAHWNFSINHNCLLFAE